MRLVNGDCIASKSEGQGDDTITVASERVTVVLPSALINVLLFVPSEELLTRHICSFSEFENKKKVNFTYRSNPPDILNDILTGFK